MSVHGAGVRTKDPVLPLLIRKRSTWDERDGNNLAVDKHTVAGRPYEILEVWFTHNEVQNSYAYDANGNRLSAERRIGGNNEYLSYEYYEPSNRIKYLKKGTTIVWAFEYDGNGNLTMRARGAQDNGGTPDFSAAGETWVYEYDLNNRLVNVKKGTAGAASAIEVARYWYDYRGLRIKTVEDGKTIRYEYDLAGALLYRDDGTDERDYIQALGQIWAETRTKAGASVSYWHHTDHLGTTECLSDASGAIVWEAGYEAFGRKVRENGSIDGLGLYTGKEYDEITGLYYFNARWYEPELGRFINEDPIRDGGNWFAYCGNDPVGKLDPTGEIPITISTLRDIRLKAGPAQNGGGACLYGTLLGAAQEYTGKNLTKYGMDKLESLLGANGNKAVDFADNFEVKKSGRFAELCVILKSHIKTAEMK